jgi:galactokinase/mevalonate kinase-like predicted kinase
MEVALRTGNLAEYAALMSRSEKNLYALHASCDSPVLRAYFESLGPLILGGKPCGAGGGGYLLVYTRPGMRHACIERATALGGQVEPVVLDQRGVQSWWEAGLTEATIEQIRQQG